MTKTDKEKAKEILEARKRAREGIDADGQKAAQSRDPLAEEERREDHIADDGVILGLGLKRSG
jgi:hypothetical protein